MVSDWYINFLSRNEGGWNPDPNEPGGAANRGVTAMTWGNLAPQLFGIPGNMQTLAAMTDRQWIDIVRWHWKTATNNGKVNSSVIQEYLTELLWWFGNVKAAQQAAKDLGYTIDVDGVNGNKTTAVLNEIGYKGRTGELLDRIYANQTATFRSWGGYGQYGQGWENRSKELYQYLKKKATYHFSISGKVINITYYYLFA
ncbi:MAG: hypothetical protein DA328_04475 [Nitrososphaeraceae archaeon]|nr:hypothetical protein [Nitrososphaeraceae archaeon]